MSAIGSIVHAHYNVTIQHINHKAMGTPPIFIEWPLYIDLVYNVHPYFGALNLENCLLYTNNYSKPEMKLKNEKYLHEKCLACSNMLTELFYNY